MTIFAKLLLALPFVLSGVAKLMDFDGAIAEQRHFDLPAPALMAALVIVTQLGGSLLLFTRWDWLGAVALAGFTAVATVIAHAYWSFPIEAQFEQRNIFFEHAAIIGGFLMVAAMRWNLRRDHD